MKETSVSRVAGVHERCNSNLLASTRRVSSNYRLAFNVLMPNETLCRRGRIYIYIPWFTEEPADNQAGQKIAPQEDGAAKLKTLPTRTLTRFHRGRH